MTSFLPYSGLRQKRGLFLGHRQSLKDFADNFSAAQNAAACGTFSSDLIHVSSNRTKWEI
jgi:hypothetical protein